MARLMTHWTRLLHVDLVPSTAAAVSLPRFEPTFPRERVVGMARRLWAWYRNRRDARIMRAELYGLDARMLRDLGLHRDEIGSVVAELTEHAAPTRLRVLSDLPGATASAPEREVS